MNTLATTAVKIAFCAAKPQITSKVLESTALSMVVNPLLNYITHSKPTGIENLDFFVCAAQAITLDAAIALYKTGKKVIESVYLQSSDPIQTHENDTSDQGVEHSELSCSADLFDNSTAVELSIFE